MKMIEETTRDFFNETTLQIAIPLVQAAKSWMFIEDVGDYAKARELNFNALKGYDLYMTNTSKSKNDYVKLYIASLHNQMVWSLYVEKSVVYPGENYHVTRT